LRTLTVVGARPQFIKVAPLARALLKAGVNDTLLHTGQHFDYEMSEVFFRELEIPAPRHNLGISGGNHGQMTGRMLESIEDILVVEIPDLVIVVGDTNSTLAAALAASKLHIPVAHIEAGLRSWNRAMPEEINRILTDHLSAHHFCSSDVGVCNLGSEGISESVHMVGDVMADSNRLAREAIGAVPDLAASSIPGRYGLVTIHRAENTDSGDRLSQIVESLNNLEMDLVFPIHPRTRMAIQQRELKFRSHIKLIEPVGYLQMTQLMSDAALLLTDSGGLQKEAYWTGLPCITFRNETEWIETVNCGWNRLLLGNELPFLPNIVKAMISTKDRPRDANLYGDGHAAEAIVEVLMQQSCEGQKL